MDYLRETVTLVAAANAGGGPGGKELFSQNDEARAVQFAGSDMSKSLLHETNDASELEGVPEVVTQIVAVVDEFGAKVMVYGQLPLGGAMCVRSLTSNFTDVPLVGTEFTVTLT